MDEIDFDEIAKLMTLLVKHHLGSQQETILELHRLGFENSRSATLLGTTTDTVRSTVNKHSAGRT